MVLIKKMVAVEHRFSHMNNIKTAMRSRLSWSKVQNLMMKATAQFRSIQTRRKVLDSR